MRRFWTSALLLLSLLFACTRPNPAHSPSEEPSEEFIKDELLLRFGAAISWEEAATRVEPWGGIILEALGVDSSDPLAITHLDGTFRVGLPEDLTVDEALSILALEDDLDFAEPHYIVRAIRSPDDSYFDRLWGMEKISAPAAWDRSIGDPGVVVGVIDTGIDYRHPDLKENMWSNPGEIPGNGLDDDGNGFIDDVYGWDFCNGDADPMDDNGHGTHCAGSIAGRGNNQIGVVGVSWRSRVMALKFLCANGTGYTINAALALRYAVDNGVTFTSNSWGGGSSSKVVYNAIQYAQEKGQLFVAAAGNEGSNNDSRAFYPASYDHPNIIAVAASDPNDQRAYFSNYGLSRVDLAAPGISIFSSLPGDRYGYKSGTSMAAPHVAGALSLLYARSPGIAWEPARDLLFESLDPIPGWAHLISTGGRLNVARLLNSLSPPPPAPEGLHLEALEGDRLSARWLPSADETVEAYRLYLRAESGENRPAERIEGLESIQGPLSAQRWWVSVSALGAGGEGPRCQEQQLEIRDQAPPARIIDLQLIPEAGPQLEILNVAASSSLGGEWSAEALLDGDPFSGWVSGSSEARLGFDLGESQRVGRFSVSLLAGFPDLAPAGLELRALAPDGTGLVLISEMELSPEEILRWDFPPVETRWLELRVVEDPQAPGLVALGELNLFGPPEEPGRLRAYWSAPGDDGFLGQATRYELFAAPGMILEEIDSAQLFGTPNPTEAGIRQEALLSGLLGETQYGAAIRAIDDSGQPGIFSPIARAWTGAIPPGQIQDLQLEQIDEEQVELSFSAPAADGERAESGPATRYLLRVSDQPINPAHWPETWMLELPVPGAPGSLERFRLPRPEGPRSHWIIAAEDQAGHRGPWSSPVSLDGEGPDFIPPAPPPLSALAMPLERLPVPLEGDQLELLDGDPGSGWMQETEGELSLTFRLLEGALLSQIRVHPHLLYTGDFPGEIRVQILGAEAPHEVLRWSGVPQPGEWLELEFAPEPAEGFSLILSQPVDRFGVRAFALGEVEAQVGLSGAGRVRLGWLAPGDDGWLGRARGYDLRWSPQAIVDLALFEEAQPVMDLPQPAEAGHPQIMLFEAPEGQEIWFALRAVDEAGNWSPLSNSPSAAPTPIPPARVEDLRLLERGRNHFELAFTATGDDGRQGQAAEYELRILEGGIDGLSFSEGRRIDTPAPKPSGELESLHVEGLEPGTLYGLALLVWDEAGSPSPLSEPLLLRTLEGDAPALVVDLQAEPEGENLRLRWTAPGDDGLLGQASLYDLRWSRQQLTTLNFQQAEALPTPAPASAGTLEQLLLEGLPREEQLFFAILVADEVGNWSELSNIAEVFSPGEAPAAPLDLRVLERGAHDLLLGFSATGDDGLLGQASAYDLRLSSAPIESEADFEAAEPLPSPAPGPPGSAEEIRVEGLEEAERYYFALVVRDEIGQGSPRALLSGDTLDQSPPEPILDLHILEEQGPAPQIADISASGAYSSYTEAVALMETHSARVWISDGGSDQWLLLELERPISLIGLRLGPGEGHEDLFPSLIRLEAEEEGFLEIRGAGEALERRFAPQQLQSLRLRFPGQEGLLALGAVELLSTEQSYSLAWTSPNDRGPQGGAARYDLRQMSPGQAPEEGEQLPTAAPALAGRPEQQRLALLPDTDYSFAIASEDEEGNRSPWSSILSLHTQPPLPSTVMDLRGEPEEQAALLRWSAPERAVEYELRWSLAPISEERWAEAEPLAVPAPSAPGLEESFRAENLEPSTLYHFALRALDVEGRPGALSNLLSLRTLDPPERIPPAAIEDLRAETDLEQDGSLLLSWTAPGDDGDLGSASRYELRWGEPPEEGQLIELPAPRPAGQFEGLRVEGLPGEQEIRFALRSWDDEENVSPWSYTSASTRAMPPALISDLRAELLGAGIELRWSAPGADGERGEADHYELYISELPMIVPGVMEPEILPVGGPAGTEERFPLMELPPDLPFYAALRAFDEKGNAGPLSRVISFAAPDQSPPGAFLELSAEPGPLQGSLLLRFLAPGDDGAQGRPAAYELRWSETPFIPEEFGKQSAYAGQLIPLEGGQAGELMLRDLPDERLIHLGIRALDNAGLVGPLAQISVETPGVPPGRIFDLSARAEGGEAVILSWTAPGGDGAVGQATAYELRSSPQGINEENWAQAERLEAPVPAAGGEAEQHRVDHLESGQRYFFALRAVDEGGRWSLVSNSAGVETDDLLAPDPVRDLRAESSEHGIRLSWTASGDDGDQGRAAQIELRAAEAPWPGFEAAEILRQTVIPLEAGSAQSIELLGLPREREMIFSLVVLDEAGNRSVPSSRAQAWTPALAPGAVEDLHIEADGAGALRLEWSAPADDEGDPESGPVQRYHLALAEHQFSAAEWRAQQLLEGPAPLSPGQLQSFRISELGDDSPYWLALIVEDDRGALSRVILAQAHTPDVQPPAAVASLSAEGPRRGGDPLPVAVVSASGSLSQEWRPMDAFDGDLRSAWASPPEGSSWLEARLQHPARLGGLRIWIGEWVDRFPGELLLELDGEQLARLGDLSPEAHSWLEISFNPRQGETLRLSFAGAEYVVINELEIVPADDPPDSIVLSWVAPGDDGSQGRAEHYDLRYDTVPIDEGSFARAERLEAPPPAPAGSPQRLELNNLLEETEYYFALISEDEAGNRSPLSNIAQASTGGIPPALIADLEIAVESPEAVQLSWTAPGSDGDEGRATRYELRYRPGDLSELNWAEGIEIPCSAPLTAGEKEHLRVEGLLPGTLYAFGIRALDERGYAARISLGYALTDPAPDRSAPGAIRDLQARVVQGGPLSPAGISASGSQFPDFPAQALLDGDPQSAWASPARDEPGEEELILELPRAVALAQLRLMPHPDFVDLFPTEFQLEGSLDGLRWEPLMEISQHEAKAGHWSEWPLNAEVRQIRLRAQRRLGEPVYLLVIADLELLEAEEPGRIILNFSAPGDDGEVGQADEYLLAHSSQPIETEADWEGATLEHIRRQPAPAGAPEAMSVSELEPGEHHFALRALDEVGLMSALGNSAVVEILR